MNRVDSPRPEPESFEQLYFRSRFPALALALALTLDINKAFECSKIAHCAEGCKPVRRISLNSILRKIIRLSPFVKAVGDAEQPVFVKLPKLDREARMVWSLQQVCGISGDELIKLLNISPQQGANALTRAEEILTPQDAERFARLVDSLLEKKELWNSILFSIARRKSAGKLVWRILSLAALAAALFFLGRETYVLVRILGLKPPAAGTALTRPYEDDDFYKRTPISSSTLHPTISQQLQDELEELEDGRALRVAFLFYDSSLIDKTRIEEQNLNELYADIYTQSRDRGRINTLAANAVNAYYANYQRPFMPEERTADFVSKYPGIYEAAMEIAGDSAYEYTIEKHPEILGSREAFEAFLLSTDFLREAPYLAELLGLEADLSESTLQETEGLRLAYERALHAFFNPGSLSGKASVSAFSFEAEGLRSFYALRERLGEAFYPLNVQSCIRSLPINAVVRSDILEGNESSLFSATLTKADILRLAEEDDRFFFLGITTPEAGFFEDRMEAQLSQQARDSLSGGHKVYRINEEFLLYSINYAAPLRLPQGFRALLTASGKSWASRARSLRWNLGTTTICDTRTRKPERAMASSGRLSWVNRGNLPLSNTNHSVKWLPTER